MHGFLRHPLSLGFSKNALGTGQKTYRPSSKRQYELVWALFIYFLQLRDVIYIDIKTIGSFLCYLIVRQLSLETVVSYIRLCLTSVIGAGY